jgi:glucoamylase
MMVVKGLGDEKTLADFANVSLKHQSSEIACPGGLGEVKFHGDGTPFTGVWGRPQNDGPALRILALGMKWPSIIYKDLNYLKNHWRDFDYDPWEEVKGHHFFTRMMEREAFLFVNQKTDFRGRFNSTLNDIERELERFWEEGPFIKETIDQVVGQYKSGLDSAVILAYTYAASWNRDIGLDDTFLKNNLRDKMESTAEQLLEAFEHLYPINWIYPNMPPAIGRYTEDRYNGYDSNGQGNPWFLLTLGMAQFFFELILEHEEEAVIKISNINQAFYKYVTGINFKENSSYSKNQEEFKLIQNSLWKMGNGFIERVRYHADREQGHMSEQMNLNTGYMQGAPDLTWNYANFLSMIREREKVLAIH